MILEGTAVDDEVIIQTFGAMDVGMLMLLAFCICKEHLFWILSLSLAYRADMLVGWQVAKMVCSICKSICWPSDMF